MTDNQIMAFDKARQQIQLARDVDEVKMIRDRAESLKQYAKQQKESLQMQNQIAEIKLRAERRIGQMLGDLERGKPGRKLETSVVSNSEYKQTLNDNSISSSSAKRWQRIATLPDETFEQFIAENVQGQSELTTAGALRVVKTGQLSPLMSSDSNEWYTTPDIINAVIEVMGDIDLDPCSNSHTAPNVPAAKHFTQKDDGLSQNWYGQVYVNPPYGRQLPLWIDKIVTEYNAGNISAIVLVPARPDTRWFRMLRTFPRCFMFGRVRFNGHENSAPFPTMLVNVGCDSGLFNHVMSELGDIYECVRL